VNKSAILLTLILASCVSRSYAEVDPYTVNLDAGLLKGPGGADTMVSDNNSPSTNGSLLLLIGAGGTGSYGGFSNSLAPGQYVSGGDIILGAGGFNSIPTHDETNTAFNGLSAGTTGQAIALRWFPQITYAQFLANVTPTAGQNFGTYNPLAAGNTGGSADNPDGGNLWIVPGPSASISLNFFTTDDPFGGTQVPSEGFASFPITSVPEPSTYTAGILAAFSVGFVRLKFKNKQDSMVQT
jgi:hypothetical protein